MRSVDVVVIGAGGHSKIVIDILLEDPTVKILGLLDDSPDAQGKEIMGFPVVGIVEEMDKLFPKTTGYIISIGNNSVRRKISKILKNRGYEHINAISKSAMISKHASIGKGVIINPGAAIHPDATIEDDVVIGMNATISHDSIVKAGVHLSPGVHITGNVTVGEQADLGAGVVVIPGKIIGRDTIVGAGAVVTKDLAEGIVAVGAPAREIKRIKETR